MWIAQHPCGTWCAYKDEPRQKMGGWDGDGETPVQLLIQNWILSWRQTKRWVPNAEYTERYKAKEVRIDT